jgi:hypothetical protein
MKIKKKKLQLGMEGHTCNQRQRQKDCELEASLGSIVRPWLSKQTQKTTELR